jgi:hypothetical protein
MYRIPILERRLSLFVDPAKIFASGRIFSDPHTRRRLDASLASGAQSNILALLYDLTRAAYIGNEVLGADELIIEECEHQFAVRSVFLKARLRDDIEPRRWFRTAAQRTLILDDVPISRAQVKLALDGLQALSAEGVSKELTRRKCFLLFAAENQQQKSDTEDGSQSFHTVSR